MHLNQDSLLLSQIYLDRLNKEWFDSEHSFSAFKYAIDCCLKLKELQEKGYRFFDSTYEINGFLVDIDGEDTRVYCDDTFFAGGIWVEKSGKIWCSKKDINNFLKEITCVPPQQVKTALSVLSEI
jgi:hypothetical protein